MLGKGAEKIDKKRHASMIRVLNKQQAEGLIPKGVWMDSDTVDSLLRSIEMTTNAENVVKEDAYKTAVSGYLLSSLEIEEYFPQYTNVISASFNSKYH